MACSEAIYHLRRNQIRSLIVLAADEFAYEQAQASVEENRLQYEHNWRLSRDIWLSARNGNSAIPKLLKSGTTRPSSSTRESNHTVRSSLPLQKNIDIEIRHEAIRYCDIQLHVLDRILNEIHTFKEERFQMTLFENLLKAHKGKSPEQRQECKVKSAIRQLCKVKSMAEDTLSSLNPLNQVCWGYSRYAISLTRTAKLTQTEAERMAVRKYWRDHNQKLGRDEIDFQRIFRLLERDDQRGWDEILSWPHEDRLAFEDWIDKRPKAAITDVADQGSDLEEPPTSLASNPPVWTRMVEWKRNGSQRCKEARAKWRRRFVSQRRRGETVLCLD